jgi:hypothetical protein
MLLRDTGGGLIARDENERRWVALARAAARHGGVGVPDDFRAFPTGGEMVERRPLACLEAGNVISTATMPSRSGLELDRWIKPGQTVELEFDGLGAVTNAIDPTYGA